MSQYYHRQSGNPLADFWRGGVVKKLIIINAAVFVLQILLMKTGFIDFFALIPRQVVTRGYIWQIVTHMFLHGGFFHLAINMFVVWMFGTPLEGVWGSSRFLKYYFVCGLGGVALQFITHFNGPTIGASAAGYGMLLAYVLWFPHNTILVMGVFPVKARTLIIVLTILELLYGLGGRDGIAHFAHLGGAIAGLIFLRNDYQTQKLWNWFRKIGRKMPIKIKIDRNERRATEGYDSKKIDSILDKISAKGYENLTETEKRILENYSKNTEKH